MVKLRLRWAGHLERTFYNILRSKFWKDVSEEEGTLENQELDGKELSRILLSDGPVREIGAQLQGKIDWKKETGQIMARTGTRKFSLAYIFEYQVAGIKYLRIRYWMGRVSTSFSCSTHLKA